MLTTFPRTMLAVALMALFSFPALADEGDVKIYPHAEYKEMVDGPQLIHVVGIVSDFGTLPLATESGITKDLQKKAAKLHATGMSVIGKMKKKGDNGWGLSGFQLHMSAEAFVFEEPTLANIRAAVHDPRNASWVAIKSATNLAKKAGYSELAEDFLDETLHGKDNKNPVKATLLSGYAKLKGKDAIPTLKQIAEDPKTPSALVSEATKLIDGLQ